jgi:predicted O-methyltransferase YrrM
VQNESRLLLGRIRDSLGRVYLRAARRLEIDARVRRAAREVSERAPRPLNAALDYAFTARPALLKIAPEQLRGELHDFLVLVQELRPRAVLEIGTALGGTLFLLTRVAAPDAILLSIDRSFERRRPLFEAFAVDRQRVSFLAGDSHAAETRARVERELGDRKLDLLFIDGDHSAQGVRADFELYSDLVRPGGLVVFHDIVYGRAELVGGVPDFWRDIKTPDAQELVADPGQGGYGIGVLAR